MTIITIGTRSYRVEDDTLYPLEEGSVYEVVKKRTDIRTVKQNAAMHKFFSLTAEQLNDKGLDMKTVIKADVPWSMEAVKNYMWRPIQKAILDKESTTKLKKDEIDLIYNTMNRLLGEKFGIHVPFPSIEQMIFEQNYKETK